MSNSKRLLFVVMFLLVIVVCLMPNLDIEDGEVSYREVTASSQTGNKQPMTVTEQENDKYIHIDKYDVGVTTEAVPGDDGLPDEIEELLSTMTIEEKVAQMFFIKNDNRFDASILEEYPVGGMILFSSDFRGESPESLTDKLASFQDASHIPLLIGVDEEGGDVVRLSMYSTLADYRFLSPRELYYEGGYDAVREDTIAKSKLLLSYGINVNFAPVCDVSLDPSEYMYNRSFGISPEATADYINVVVNSMEAEHMGSVMKHFPGYGSNGDTHTDIVRDYRDYESFLNGDFLPFIEGINQGADCVLVSHNIVECMDSEMPASLSGKVIGILRNDLGFDGVIITDDLMMSGVSDYVSERESAVMAIIAGNDMILSADYSLQYESVLEAVYDGRITEERIDESVTRILLWKYELGLIK